MFYILFQIQIQDKVHNYVLFHKSIICEYTLNRKLQTLKHH